MIAAIVLPSVRRAWSLLALLALAAAASLLAAAPAAYQALPVRHSTPPSARQQAAATATGSAGWLFGGQDGGGARNDLWQHAPASGWARHGGGGAGAGGVYSNLGGAAFAVAAPLPLPAAPWPGSRLGATLFSVGDGRLNMFGGYGTAAGQHAGYLNDLWVFDDLGPQAGWTWWGGSDQVDQPPCTGGVDCQQLCPSAIGGDHALVGCSWPGGRRSASFWHDRSVRRSGTTARVRNAGYEADELPEVGFFYASPEDWSANGTVVVVRNGVSKSDKFYILKTRNFVLKTRNFVVKTRNFVVKTRKNFFLIKMMNSADLSLGCRALGRRRAVRRPAVSAGRKILDISAGGRAHSWQAVPCVMACCVRVCCGRVAESAGQWSR